GWMSRRHDWDVDPAAIFTTHGVVAGLALCLQAYTRPGDGVILFTPVYHAFHRIIAANGREIVQSPLVRRADGRYAMDLDVLAAALTGRERMLVFCSPHNPGGRVWSPEEIRALADFCRAHDLLLVSDEIHHDLVLSGRHVPTPIAAPESLDRLVMLTAATKTFNIAGCLTGNAIIPDPELRKRFAATHLASGTSPNRFGALMTTAAYAHGDAWVDALCRYLAGNAELFASGVGAIPGVRPMPLDSTYLAWVDFSGTGMPTAEFTARVEKGARIAASHGATFGKGGESFLRFNLATPRARVTEAVARLQSAFADLQ
ncbi:MAG TPA: aminotransferase class I/II-fold pyridoxal phosphate-dependent enzyme, partial [Amaricoccus sp.]